MLGGGEGAGGTAEQVAGRGSRGWGRDEGDDKGWWRRGEGGGGRGVGQEHGWRTGGQWCSSGVKVHERLIDSSIIFTWSWLGTVTGL